MTRTVAIGKQDFAAVRESNCFYVDKTDLIRQWWESQDDVTLLTRPRRFGKTLNMSMLDYFFSVNHKEKSHLFEGLSIWQYEEYRQLQGTYPVLFMSFAGVKENSMTECRKQVCHMIENLYMQNRFLLDWDGLADHERQYFTKVSAEMEDYVAASSIQMLCQMLSRYYHKKVILLLDEYDTPMQESYVNDFWNELTGFFRNFFNATFKTNPYMERALLTGITRVSKESIFSDLNNMNVITVTCNQYADAFGFTQAEVEAALREYGLEAQAQQVKHWYDGFTFGEQTDIYNPWSVINYLNDHRFQAYWANTSSNSLVSKLIREGDAGVKQVMEDLLCDKPLVAEIDEQIVYEQLDTTPDAVWSLLLAAGYLKVGKHVQNELTGMWQYELLLTNFEVKVMFRQLISGWFRKNGAYYPEFIKALLAGDIKAMNHYMNTVALTTISYFDTGKEPSVYAQPERFYHGFVLGLLVELAPEYTVTSNRESGLGRYDIQIEPKDTAKDAMLIEFKVQDAEEEEDMRATAQAALKQIEQKQYAAALQAKGFTTDKIHAYGFAFAGKQVLIMGKDN